MIFSSLLSIRSHPMRVRGLKPIFVIDRIACESVAPHAGAWIETSSIFKGIGVFDVAPHAGAWIET